MWIIHLYKIHCWSNFRDIIMETIIAITIIFVWMYLYLTKYDGGCSECEGGYIEVCSECLSQDIGEHFAGDEGWTICEGCRAIEQGYTEVRCEYCNQSLINKIKLWIK